MKITPKEQTEILLSEFQKQTKSLFFVSKPDHFIEFEKGLYGALYLKPVKRISKLLSSDREILTLFSTFPDQQPRTVEVARNTIASEGTRLEHTLVIVIHCDANGNDKLKGWGRESGLTVLPIFSDGTIPGEADLERQLLQEFFSHDPFDVTGPVSDDGRFFGRKNEAQDIARQLQRGQIRSCLGIRKIGKTSIMSRVLREVRQRYTCYSVVVDCSKDGVWSQSAGELLTSIAKAIEQANAAQNSHTEISTKVLSNIRVDDGQVRLSFAASKCDRPILIFFDEIDYITPSSPTASERWKKDFNPFWRNFRAAYQEASRSGKIVSVFVSGVSSKWFRLESLDGVENAALAFIPEEYLSALALDATITMLRTIGKTCGLVLTDESAGEIAKACSNMPYWSRKACSFIHKNIAIDVRPYELSTEEAKELLQDFLESEGSALAEVALGHLFRVYPELLPAAKEVFQRSGASISPQILLTLRKYGLTTIDRIKAIDVIESGMMTAGMEAQLQTPALDQAQFDKPQPMRQPTLGFQNIDDWADELAIINAGRNKLEKKLRTLVVNFVRMSSLQTKGTSVTDRLTKVLMAERRSKLSHLAADELIERYNWSELAAVIESEWGIFSPLFNDKGQFKNHANVVNDRYDAHAKDADLADLALYRKSLNWLEEQLAKASM